MIAESDHACPIGVVGSVVPLTILAVVVFLYVQNRRKKQQQIQDLNGKHTSSMYEPPMPSVPFVPYVGLLLSRAEPGTPSLLCCFFLSRTPPIRKLSPLRVQRAQ